MVVVPRKTHCINIPHVRFTHHFDFPRDFHRHSNLNVAVHKHYTYIVQMIYRYDSTKTSIYYYYFLLYYIVILFGCIVWKNKYFRQFVFDLQQLYSISNISNDILYRFLHTSCTTEMIICYAKMCLGRMYYRFYNTLLFIQK